MTYKFKNDKLFIGVIDKNGNEIYDGDRVLVSNDWQGVKDATGIVKYVPERALFAVFYDTPDLVACSDKDGVNYNWDDFNEIDEVALITEAI